MKAGFLGGRSNAATRAQSIVVQQTTTNSLAADTQSPAQHGTHAPPAPPASPPPRQATATATAPSEESWRKCMELLESPSEEKKFVGLLLVTKLLPHGSDAALSAVLHAVGWPFLQRMLLPLRQQQQQQGQQQALPDDKLQQQQLSVSLGLSIISAAARVAEIAASEELLQLTPLLAKVAAAGGVSHVLSPPHQQQAGSQSQGQGSFVDAAGDLATVVDALEVLLAVGSSGSYQRTVLLESNCLQAATAALACALTAAVHSTPAQTPTGMAVNNSTAPAEEAAAATAVAAARAIMLSVQLLGVLLQGGDAASSLHPVQQHPAWATAAVMLSAAVFGGSCKGSNAAAQHGSSTQQPGSQGIAGVDAAALQLQALHTLLLLLPLPESAVQPHAALAAAAEAVAAGSSESTSEAAKAALAALSTHCSPGVSDPASSNQLVLQAAAAAGDWPSCLRQGLLQVLRSRVGAVQRHSALQLTAATLELLGRGWLLPQQQQGLRAGAHAVSSSGSSSSRSGRAEEFLLVLMEVLAIETPLLLSDAMNAGAAVPKSDQPMAAAAAATNAGDDSNDEVAAAGGAASGGSDDGVDAEMDEPAAQDGTIQPLTVRQAVEQQLDQQQSDQQPGGSSQPVNGNSSWPGPPGFQQSPQQQQQQQQQKPLRQQLAELKLPEDGPVGHGQQPAGARALQVLPSCYHLLEGCLEVLVEQVSLLDELANLDQPMTQEPAGTAAAAGGGAAAVGSSSCSSGEGVLGVRPVSWQEVLPVLGIQQVEQLMGRMGQVTQVVCEFLQYATSPTAGVMEGAAPVDTLLVLGAVRLLGRFLADAPEVHGVTVRKLLPHLIKLQAGSTSSSSMAGTPGVATAAALQESRLQAPGQCAGAIPVPVLSFMLPAMLAWTSRHSSHHQAWVECMLKPDSGCVEALAAYAGHAAVAAAATASRAAAEGATGTSNGLQEDQAQASDGAVVAEAEAQLGTASQVLFQLLSSRAVLLSARHQHQQAAQSSLPVLHQGHAAALSGVLEQLCRWSAARRHQQPRRQQQPEEQADGLALAFAAASEVELLRLQDVGLQLTTLLPAAALAGQLLGLVEVSADAAAASTAAQLLCWGCQVGWYTQLLVACQQLPAGASRSQHLTVLVQELMQMWEVAELDELWEACLLAAAELLTHHGAGSAVGQALSEVKGSKGWLGQAMQGMGGGGNELAVARVMGQSMGLQLLLEASATVL